MPPSQRFRLPNGRIVEVEPRDTPEIPDPPDRFWNPMDIAGNYEPPFAPATRKTDVCICVCCGNSEKADYEIGQYPFRYIPTGWSVNATNKALRCSRCRDANKTEPEFYSANDVWVDHQDPRARDYQLQNGTRVTKRQANSHVPSNDLYIPVARPAAVSTAQETRMPIIDHEEDETPTRGARLKKQGKDVAGAFGAGLQLAAANEAGEVLVDIAKELTSELPMAQLALAHPDGREVAKVLMALMLHTATEQTDIIPQGEFIGEACKLQMTASSFTLIAPRLNQVRKHLTKLAKIGERTASPALKARVAEQSDEDLAEAYAELEEELEDLKARMAAEEEATPKKKARSRKKPKEATA